MWLEHGSRPEKSVTDVFLICKDDIVQRYRFQKDKNGPLEDFEKIDFEKYVYIAMMGYFDPKCFFLPKLTSEPKTPPRGTG